ncbi:uncharacterized protein EV422DRAFT_514561 [Fimicolochytrium jonesii]|uniref:uncharacterized protein n=1 Tax=Fimicolochytrium jonesii TaxID=1396493 RepID=UPI0022FE19FD|nr:uncharacterized protein EV422DRAFT_514561 [Fimicolochytrium jonesii]KAI8825877.1 hypothetical protein EV422DRAFT_514561 [Fimicolochytrium jonesii]
MGIAEVLLYCLFRVVHILVQLVTSSFSTLAISSDNFEPFRCCTPKISPVSLPTPKAFLHHIFLVLLSFNGSLATDPSMLTARGLDSGRSGVGRGGGRRALWRHVQAGRREEKSFHGEAIPVGRPAGLPHLYGIYSSRYTC